MTLCLHAGAAAQATPLHIEWAASTPCGQPTNLARDVEQLLGQGGQPPLGWRFAVQVRDHATDAGTLELTLRVITPTSERQRTIDVDSCEQAARTAAVLIAVAIDPTVATSVAAIPTTVETTTTTTPVTTTEHDTVASPIDEGATPGNSATPSSSSGSDSPRSWGLGAIVGLDIARLHHVTPELALRGVVRAPWLRAELAASWLAPTALEVPERDGARLDRWAASVVARGCVLGPVWGLQIGPCATARVGWIHASSSGVDSNLPKNTWLWSAGAAGVIEWPLTRSLTLDLLWGGDVSLVRPTFRVRGSTASHTLPLLSTQVGLGVWMRFG